MTLCLNYEMAKKSCQNSCFCTFDQGLHHAFFLARGEQCILQKNTFFGHKIANIELLVNVLLHFLFHDEESSCNR